MAIIPDRLRDTKLYRNFQRLLRILQFLSSVISLGLFSARIRKIIKYVHRANASDGAVEGILAAAVAYTLLTTILSFLLKKGFRKPLRWLLIALDIAFIGAFIAVAVLTRPNHGPSGPCTNSRRFLNTGRFNCKLPWGTFILAIISTLLHALSALFHEARDHHDQVKAERETERKREAELKYGA